MSHSIHMLCVQIDTKSYQFHFDLTTSNCPSLQTSIQNEVSYFVRMIDVVRLLDPKRVIIISSLCLPCFIIPSFLSVLIKNSDDSSFSFETLVAR